MVELLANVKEISETVKLPTGKEYIRKYTKG